MKRIILANHHNFIRSGLILILKKEIPYFLIFALAFISSSAVAQTAGDTQRTIRVVMDNDYAPYVLQSAEGKLEGILIDQWKAWEKKTGRRVDIHAMDWGEAIRHMRTGEYDVIDCIVKTPGRQDYFDFTPAYTRVEASIFFRKDISGITDLASLKGFPIGVKTGDQHIDELNAAGVTTIIMFPNNDAIIKAAKEDKINVFLVDDPSALYLLNKMGIDSEFRHSAPIFREELRRAVRKGDTALLTTISKGFAAIEPGELKQIDEKWFGRTINRNDSYRRYLSYAGYIVAAAVLIILCLVVWNRTLRRRVFHRTTALRSAYQRLAYHVENTPLAVIEFDKDFFIKRWSKRAEEIFGWNSSEALGKNVYDPDFPVIYKEDIPQVDKINEQLMKGSVNRNLSLNRNYTKDGNIIYSEWYNSVLKDDHGNVITILSLVHNVTERKKAEEQKEFEQRDKEALINTTDDMIWSVSRDLKLIAVNKAYIREIEALTGVTVKPGDEVLMPDVVPPEIVAFWKEAYDRALSGETFKKDTFIPAFNKSAESWRETSYHPIYKDETVVAVACYSRDITERKKAEKTLQQSYEEIRRLTEHLQKIREEERIHIAREIHDELGQQLTAVKMDVAWIDKKIPEETTDIKRKLKNIIELLDGSNQSIRRILSQLRPRILDDHGLLEAIEWLGWQFSETTGILVKFTTPEKDFKVTEEIVTCLFRVSQEALTNITRYALAKNVSISISITEENIILIIEDNGIGFDTATVQTKKSFGILGMKERVLSLGGKFELVSSEGKGTKITVSLPYST